MFCKYCGREINKTAKFCPYCGGLMAADSVSADSASESVPDPEAEDAERSAFQPSVWEPVYGEPQTAEQQEENPDPEGRGGERECLHCGNRIPPGSAVCPVCGVRWAPENRMPEGGMGTEPEIPAARESVPGTGTSPGSLQSKKIVSEFCGGGLFLIFTCLLTAYFVVQFLSGGNYPFLTALSSVPLLLLTAGCWIFYADSFRRHASPAGFVVVTTGLAAYAACFFLLCGYFFLIGIRLAGSETDRLLAAGTIVISLLVLAAGWWGLERLWRVCLRENAVRKIGAVQWKSSAAAVVLLCVKLVWDGLLLANVLKEPVRTLFRRYLILDQGSQQKVTDQLTKLFNYMGNRGQLGILSYLLSAAVTFLAILILAEIRRTNLRMQQEIKTEIPERP